MSNKKSTRISRRDTIKILAAAAGAGALANVPSKWTKPGMDFGLLPAHAQTSQIIHTLQAGADAMIDANVGQPPITINSTVQITPPDSGIVMRYLVVLEGSTGASSPAGIDSPNPLTGTVTTNGEGTGILPITYSEVGPNATITVTWSFENPDDGTGTDDQVFQTPEQALHTLEAGADAMINANVGQPPITINSTVQITPPDSGIVMRYSVVLEGSTGASSPAGIDLPNPLTGTVTTNGEGTGILPITYSEVGSNATITVTWSFENPDDGTGTDDQVFQTPEQVLHSLEAGLDADIDTNVEGDPVTITSTVQITPPDPGIVMRYNVALDEGNGLPRPAGIDSPNPLTGTVATNDTGQASVDVTYSDLWFNSTITVTWSFENSSDGTGTDEQIFKTPEYNP